ncbi:hypothetical protein SHI21_16310 [Bacteriovorax sp. PP10]|uniref:Uncharacterized protein n=1 Tax=Bacteriovorax antarcticus TaxID=3088717 RepID=A0ABU5VXR6_9BACT|nr:hypothetical protein [Bacteriovorax sp. PP10]MEA9357796.1 hypothetical protein [Bacteriovorax sp. PP10]
MKNIFKTFLIVNCLSILPVAHAVDNAGDIGLSASALTFKVYKMAVSTSALCTDLITVVDNGNTPVAVNFLSNPDLGNGVLANGTYNCIVIEFSDVLSFTPSTTSTSGNCVASTPRNLDICRSDNGGSSKLIDGSTTSCTGTNGANAGVYGTPGADRVSIYLSTGVTTGGNDAFNPPLTLGVNTHGFNLASPLVITGTSSGKFTVNPTGKVCDSAHSTCGGVSGTCGMEPPVFSFSKL